MTGLSLILGETEVVVVLQDEDASKQVFKKKGRARALSFTPRQRKSGGPIVFGGPDEHSTSRISCYDAFGGAVDGSWFWQKERANR